MMLNKKTGSDEIICHLSIENCQLQRLRGIPRGVISSFSRKMSRREQSLLPNACHDCKYPLFSK
jgi:hypothetical protein